MKPPRTFEQPWESRAFGMARALAEHGDLDHERFRTTLVDEIHSGVERSYYEHWQAALERVLAEQGAVSPTELAARVEAHESASRSTHRY